MVGNILASFPTTAPVGNFRFTYQFVVFIFGHRWVFRGGSRYLLCKILPRGDNNGLPILSADGCGPRVFHRARCSRENHSGAPEEQPPDGDGCPSLVPLNVPTDTRQLGFKHLPRNTKHATHYTQTKGARKRSNVPVSARQTFIVYPNTIAPTYRRVPRLNSTKIKSVPQRNRRPISIKLPRQATKKANNRHILYYDSYVFPKMITQIWSIRVYSNSWNQKSTNVNVSNCTSHISKDTYIFNQLCNNVILLITIYQWI